MLARLIVALWLAAIPVIARAQAPFLGIIGTQRVPAGASYRALEISLPARWRGMGCGPTARQLEVKRPSMSVMPGMPHVSI